MNSEEVKTYVEVVLKRFKTDNAKYLLCDTQISYNIRTDLSYLADDACRYGDLDLLNFLIKKGVVGGNQWRGSLHIACCYGQLVIIDRLMEHTRENNLHYDIMVNNLGCTDNPACYKLYEKYNQKKFSKVRLEYLSNAHNVWVNIQNEKIDNLSRFRYYYDEKMCILEQLDNSIEIYSAMYLLEQKCHKLNTELDKFDKKQKEEWSEWYKRTYATPTEKMSERYQKKY